MNACKVSGCAMKNSVAIVLSVLLVAANPVHSQDVPQSYPFARYPAQGLYKGGPVPPKLTSPTQHQFRTVLRKGAQKGPNFAGHYTVVEWGCGSNCVVFAVVDAVNGKVYDSGMPSVNDEYPCGLLYRIESRLFVVEKSSTPNGDCKARFYTWDGSRFIPDDSASSPEGGLTWIRLQQRELSQHDDWWSINVKYPIIETDNTFNTAIRRQVTATADGFRKGLPSTASKGYPDYGAYLKGRYTAEILKNGVISVLFDYDEYTPGAVHPWGVMASINYDTRSGRFLGISDLFRPGCNYVSRLSEISIHELEQHEYAQETAIRNGAGPVEKNFQVFTLTDTELVLHFQQYQVAPGAVPAEQVSIPLSNLAHLLQKDYLAGQ